MSFNCNFVPEFGDTGEYLRMSETLLGNNIRTIFYPLLIRISKGLGKITGMGYQVFIYIFQSVVALVSIIYFFITLRSVKKTNWSNTDIILYSLFFFFIPQVLEFHFSVLTDSLACSMLLFLVTFGMNWIHNGKLTMKELCLMILVFVINSLLRYERKILGIVFLLIIGILAACCTKQWKRNFIVTLFVLAISLVLVKCILYVTPQDKNYARHKMNISMLLLPKVARGYMAECYGYLTDQAKELITPEMAAEYDKNPLATSDFLKNLESQIGEKQTNKLVIQNSLRILKRTWWRQLCTIIKNCLIYANPFLFGVLEMNVWHIGGLDWNYSRFVMHTPALSKIYYNYTLYMSFFLIFELTLYFLLNKFNKTMFKRHFRLYSVPAIMVLLLVGLWGVVNNSRPNDRYVLYIYYVWFLLLIFEIEAIVLERHEVSFVTK